MVVAHELQLPQLPQLPGPLAPSSKAGGGRLLPAGQAPPSACVATGETSENTIGFVS